MYLSFLELNREKATGIKLFLSDHPVVNILRVLTNLSDAWSLTFDNNSTALLLYLL